MPNYMAPPLRMRGTQSSTNLSTFTLLTVYLVSRESESASQPLVNLKFPKPGLISLPKPGLWLIMEYAAEPAT